MTDDDKISLKEYLEERFDRLERDIEKQFDMRDRQYEKALTLQAKEYERRLEDLNHEAGQLKTMQRTYVSQDVYDQKNIQNEKDIRELREWKSNLEGKMTIIVAVSNVATLTISLLVTIALHFIGR